MLLWTMDQMRELQLQWARELYWQEGQARGAIRTCKAMGLDFADALQHLQALLPELPQVNAERLARYYWKEESVQMLWRKSTMKSTAARTGRSTACGTGKNTASPLMKAISMAP